MTSLPPSDGGGTGGPARYVRVEETGGKLGFITPLTNNFCDGCNRIRVTATGQLYACLGWLVFFYPVPEALRLAGGLFIQ